MLNLCHCCLNFKLHKIRAIFMVAFTRIVADTSFFSVLACSFL